MVIDMFGHRRHSKLAQEGTYSCNALPVEWPIVSFKKHHLEEVVIQLFARPCALWVAKRSVPRQLKRHHRQRQKPELSIQDRLAAELDPAE